MRPRAERRHARRLDPGGRPDPASAGAATARTPAATRATTALTALDVYEAAAAGDALACELVEDVGRRLPGPSTCWSWPTTSSASSSAAASPMPASPSWTRSGANSSACAPPRRLAGELLPAGVVETLPPGADAGAWGAVAIAQQALTAPAPSAPPPRWKEVRDAATPARHVTTTTKRQSETKEEQRRSMNTRRAITLTALLALVIGACSPAATTAPSAASAAPPSAAAIRGPVRVGRGIGPGSLAQRGGPRAGSGRGGHPGRRAGRRDQRSGRSSCHPRSTTYIKDTIDRFEATYPGVKVKWEDHQGTFKDDLNDAFAAGIAPDVINLSVSEGWVSEYAEQGPAARPRQHGPASPSRTSTSPTSGSSSSSTA